MGEHLRLQVWLARAGFASRRGAEALIAAGSVRLNGQVVRAPGTVAEVGRDHVEVRGRGPALLRPRVWLALHKPAGFISTVSDPEGRPTVTGMLGRSRALGRRLHEGDLPPVVPVGRLDFDAEGLLLMSNDGPLAQALLHPRHHVPKVYLVKVQGRPDPAALDALAGGVRLREPDGRLGRATAAAKVVTVRAGPRNTWLRLTLREGRNRQVKRMCEAVGHRVCRLVRTDFAGLALGSLPAGAWRHLTADEVDRLARWAEKAAPVPAAELAKRRPDRRMRRTQCGEGG